MGRLGGDRWKRGWGAAVSAAVLTIFALLAACGSIGHKQAGSRLQERHRLRQRRQLREKTTGGGPTFDADESLHDQGGSGLGTTKDGPLLPQCYSSPSANPSDGVWRKTENGTDDSPFDMSEHPFADNKIEENEKAGWCRKRWENDHASEEPMPYYSWEPKRCRLAEVDMEGFCRVMEGRKGLLIVGDSLSNQMALALATILHADHIVDKPHEHHEWLACEGTVTLTFRRNDYLDTRTHPSFYDRTHCEAVERSRSTLCTVFADDDTLSAHDTIVVNSGAHPRPVETYSDTMWVASETLTASMTRFHGEDAILVYRNSVPGHYGCEDMIFDGPVDLVTALQMQAGAPPTWQWPLFHDFNNRIEAAFDSVKGWRRLDAYTPTIFRADFHHVGDRQHDCLHYCIPGPIDHWVRLLYNILVVETTDRGKQ